MFGPVTNPKNKDLKDLSAREYATLLPLVIMCFWIGIYPKPFFKYIEKPVEKIVQRVQPGFFDRTEAKLAKLPPVQEARKK